MSNSTPGHVSPHQQVGEESNIDLRALLNLVVVNKVFIGIIVAICMVIGSLYAFTRAPIYQSTALIEVEASSSSASNLLTLMNVAGADPGGFSSAASPAEIQTSLIQSEYIMEDVIEQLKLNISVRQHYLPFVGRVYSRLNKGAGGGFIAKILPSFSWSSSETAKVSEFTVPKYLEGVEFHLIADDDHGHYSLFDEKNTKILSGIVGEKVESTIGIYPISLVVSELRARPGLMFSIKKTSTKEAVEQILESFNILEIGLKTGVLKLYYSSPDPEFSQVFLNSVLDVVVRKNIATKAEEAAKTLDFLGKQLPSVSKDLGQAETMLNDYRSKSGNIDSEAEAEILMQQTVTLQQEIQDLKLKKLELLQGYTEEHPYIIALNHQQAVLENRVGEVEVSLRKLPQTEQKATSYKRDISVQGSIYTNVVQNMQQMEILKASTVSAVRILTFASYAVVPVASKASMTVIVSMMLGLFISLSILLLKQVLRKGIDNPLFAERELGVPTLAIIPYSCDQLTLMKKLKQRKTNASYLLAQIKPKDPSVEALRSLRTSIKLSLLNKKNSIIAITGCSPGVGKSFIAANLAFLFADLNQKVLLIDADMRKGHSYKLVGGNRAPGLSEYLQTDRDFTSTVQEVSENIDLMSTGNYPEKPAELLVTDKFQLLLHQVSEIYDLVIIDTPPVLAVTDAALILRYATTNLLVIGLEKDELKELQYVKNTLEKAGSQLHGAVYNNSKKNLQTYGYVNYHYTYE